MYDIKVEDVRHLPVSRAQLELRITNNGFVLSNRGNILIDASLLNSGVFNVYSGRNKNLSYDLTTDHNVHRFYLKE